MVKSLMCKWLFAVSALIFAAECFIWFRMKHVRKKWIDETKRFEETIERLGIPRSIL